MASLYTADTLPTTSAAAIRAFDERYLAGVSAVQPPTWATDYGDSFDLDSPLVTFPMSFLATRYIETKEQSGRFKTLQEKSFDLNVVEYDAGYDAKLLDLFTKVFAYRKWNEIPARFIMAEAQHVLDNIARLLEDTAQTSPWDDVAFFSASHKANPTGDPSSTFSNLQASAKDVLVMSNITDEITLMKGVLDENGKKMNPNPTVIMVPTEKGPKLEFALAQQLSLIGAGATAPSSNPYAGKFTVVTNPQLTDVNDWYLIDPVLMKKQGVPAWLDARFLPPKDLGLRFWDESSDYFKDTGHIKTASHIWHGFSLLFPHAIRKVVGA